MPFPGLCQTLLFLLWVLTNSGAALAAASTVDPEVAQVQRRFQEILAASEGKDLARLDSYHLYGPRFSKFANDGGAREDAQLARQKEHESITALSGLSMRADALKIDVFGPAAVATFILKVQFKAGTNDVQRAARGTLVFVKDAGQWKIAHEHFSAQAAQR